MSAVAAAAAANGAEYAEVACVEVYDVVLGADASSHDAVIEYAEKYEVVLDCVVAE